MVGSTGDPEQASVEGETAGVDAFAFGQLPAESGASAGARDAKDPAASFSTIDGGNEKGGVGHDQTLDVVGVETKGKANGGIGQTMAYDRGGELRRRRRGARGCWQGKRAEEQQDRCKL